MGVRTGALVPSREYLDLERKFENRNEYIDGRVLPKIRRQPAPQSDRNQPLSRAAIYEKVEFAPMPGPLVDTPDL
jgi:hypothetical protein